MIISIMLFYIMELIRHSLYYYNIFFEIAKYLTRNFADRLTTIFATLLVVVVYRYERNFAEMFCRYDIIVIFARRF